MAMDPNKSKTSPAKLKPLFVTRQNMLSLGSKETFSALQKILHRTFEKEGFWPKGRLPCRLTRWSCLRWQVWSLLF